MKNRIPAACLFLCLFPFLLRSNDRSTGLPYDFFMNSKTSDNSIILQWFRETEDLEMRISAVSLLAGRDDSDFSELMESFNREILNGNPAANRFVFAVFLRESFLHLNRNPNWRFISDNDEILGKMLLSLNEYPDTFLRSSLLRFLPSLTESQAVKVLIEEFRRFRRIITDNEGRLPENLSMELGVLIEEAVFYNSGSLQDSVWELYSVCRTDWINRKIKNAQILPKAMD